MLDTVTISGYGTYFEAVTCEQYVRKRWGGIGILVATLLTRAAEIVSAVDDGIVMHGHDETVESVIKLDGIGGCESEVVAFAFPTYVCLFLKNLEDSQVQKIQETAQWMCQTFRPHPAALRMSRFS